MDAGAHIGLGHGDGGVLLQAPRQLHGEDGRLIGPPQHPLLGIAQDAQAVLRLEQGLFRGVVAALHPGVFVDPRAEEDEVLGVQPAQEGQLLVPPRRVGAERLQLRHRAGHQVQHGREIGDRGPGVGQRRAQARQELVLAVGADAVDHHLDHGFPANLALGIADALVVPANLDHRMEHGADLEALVGDLAHDAVHQEGRVLLDDLHQVELGGLGGAGPGGAGDPEDGREPAALVGEAPEAGEIGRQVV